MWLPIVAHSAGLLVRAVRDDLRQASNAKQTPLLFAVLRQQRGLGAKAVKQKVRVGSQLNLDSLAWSAMPKTGSTTVERAILSIGMHKAARRIEKHDVRKYWHHKESSYRIFTAIRRPDTWLRSVYFYAWENSHPRGNRKGLPAFAGPICTLFPYLGGTFDQYWESVCRVPGILDSLYMTYGSLADYHLRTENLIDDLAALLERFGATDEQLAIIRESPAMNRTRMKLDEISEDQSEAVRESNPIAWRMWEMAGVYSPACLDGDAESSLPSSSNDDSIESKA